MLWLQLEPSFVRKIGSSPWVSTNRCWTLAAATDIPSLGWWQVAQERPLVPRLWKNGPVRSIPPPAVLWVSDAPVGFAKNVPLGMNESPVNPAAAITPTSARIAAPLARNEIRNFLLDQDCANLFIGLLLGVKKRRRPYRHFEQRNSVTGLQRRRNPEGHWVPGLLSR